MDAGQCHFAGWEGTFSQSLSSEDRASFQADQRGAEEFEHGQSSGVAMQK